MIKIKIFKKGIKEKRRRLGKSKHAVLLFKIGLSSFWEEKQGYLGTRAAKRNNLRPQLFLAKKEKRRGRVGRDTCGKIIWKLLKNLGVFARS